MRGSHRLVRGNETRLRVDAAITCSIESKRLGIKFDVVEAPEWMAGSLGISLLRRLPVVVNLHSPLSLIAELGGQSSRDIRFADRLERAAARAADVVTAPSAVLASYLRERSWLQTDPEIVRHPIDATYWESVGPANNTDPIVLAIGRIEQAKNPDVLVRAVAAIPGDRIEVVFVGRGAGVINGRTPEAWISSLARDLGVRCSILGELSRHELKPVIERARVIAVASRFETFSLAAIEGMAAGRPVVCSETVGAAEIISDTGAGVVVPPSNAELLGQALAPYLHDAEHAAIAGRLGREVVRAGCDPSVIATKRLECYRAAIDHAA